MKSIAVLWDDEVSYNREEPFKNRHLNQAYRLFSTEARKEGAEAYIGRFDRYEDGKLEEAFRFNSEWTLREEVDIDIVFDKYRFDQETRKLKETIDRNMPVLNRYKLEKICKDKLETYRRFPSVVPETGIASRKNFEQMVAEHGKVVFKPRYSFGGKGIEFYDRGDSFEEPESKHDYVLQAFIDASQGIPQLGVEGVHDLRLYVLNRQILDGYIRTPESGLISNISQGGKMEFLDLRKVPAEAKEIAGKIAEDLSGLQPNFFALDMVRGADQNFSVMELNSKPGMAFYDDKTKKKRKKAIMNQLIEVLNGM